MLSRRDQRLSRHPRRLSFAGTGLLERMRSTTFALLGTTAALGLGLVAIVSQQGWPQLPSAPIPGLSQGQGQLDQARVAGSSAAAVAPALATAQPSGTPSLSTGEAESDRFPSRLAGSREVGTAPIAIPSDPDPGTPGGPETPAEPAAPAAPAAPATPAPDPTPAVPSPAAAPPVSSGGAGAVTAANKPAKGKDAGKQKPSGKEKPAGSVKVKVKPSPAPKGKSAQTPPPASPPPPAKPDKPPVAVPVPESGTTGSPGKGADNAHGHPKK